MCNLIILYKILENFPIITLHSRYEQINRLEHPPRVTEYTYKVYAPIDVSSHGTWIGINEEKVLIAVTNQYSTVEKEKVRSRGLLVMETLGKSSSAKEALRYIKKELQKGYKTANLVILDPKKAFHLIFDKKISVREIEAGEHVVTPLTPVEGKEINNRLAEIKERAKSRKNRSIELLKEMRFQNLKKVLGGLKEISRDHNEEPSLYSICYHDPRGKKEETSATMIAINEEDFLRSRIFYCPNNPCENKFIDYSHIFQEKSAGGEIQPKTKKLEGKKIGICVTGSVASILSPKLARELRRHGAEVKSYLTQSAIEYGVNPNVMEWATGKKPIVNLSGSTEHLEDFDTVIIYPCTYNTIGKITHGVADNAVTTLCGAIDKDKLILAPAMSLELWMRPKLQENITALEKRGVTILPPNFNEGIAKITGISETTDEIIRNSRRTVLEARKVLILTGPTRYDLDPVRYIANKSTGRLGYHLSRESYQWGGDTTVIYGPGRVEMPPQVDVSHVYTTKEMLEKTIETLEADHYQIAIFSAAVLDFRPERKASKKIPSGQSIEVNLKPTPKIIQQMKERTSNLFTIGFKLEYNIERNRLIERGYEALKEQKANLVVANDLAKIQANYHPAYIIDKEKNVKESKGSKRKLAANIFKSIEEHL